MGLFAAFELPSVVALLALAMTIGWLLWRSHRYLARQDKAWSPPVRPTRRAPHGERPARNAPDDVVLWEVEMHDTARELSGQLESKMSALAHLISEADRAAGRLEAALASVGQLPRRDPAPQTATGQTPGSSDRLDPLPPHPTDQAEALKSAGAADRASAALDVASETGEPKAGKQRPPADQRYEEVYLLADYGFDAAEIAHRVGSPVGEVELILALREQ